MTTHAREWLEKHAVTRPIGSAMQVCREFSQLLDSRPAEEAIQQFLQRNPFVLAQQLPHCHYVIPKLRLGAQYVTDFILPEMSSGGTTWTLVELEPADTQLTTSKGLYADRIRQGLQQLRNWRSWLEENKSYARQSHPNGLGFGEIAGVDAWLIVGRRRNASLLFNQLRQQTLNGERITIKTYDRLLEWFQKRAEFLDRYDAAVLAKVQSSTRSPSK
jgi:hypothetical protein